MWRAGFPSAVSFCTSTDTDIRRRWKRGVRTAAGSTLADYAAAHPNEVSLYDLYMNLYRKASQAAEYMWTLEEGSGSAEQ